MTNLGKTESLPENLENESESGWYVRRYKSECYDENGDFDWEAYQELCDTAEYWAMD